MAMFPLGSVLLPAMPLQLRVFEERYLLMLSELVAAEQARFGVVLIERGFEVGGGDARFGVGTVAEILQVAAEGGVVGLAAQGGTRFEVVEWLDDAPHPRAQVRELADLIRRALDGLNERQRMAVVLNKFEDMNYAEIAEVMGLTTKAVKSLLSRARTNLRAALSEYIYMDGRPAPEPEPDEE
jgi:RNA polymerase sigma factor (sigma-70 family)